MYCHWHTLSIGDTRQGEAGGFGGHSEAYFLGRPHAYLHLTSTGAAQQRHAADELDLGDFECSQLHRSRLMAGSLGGYGRMVLVG